MAGTNRNACNPGASGIRDTGTLATIRSATSSGNPATIAAAPVTTAAAEGSTAACRNT